LSKKKFRKKILVFEKKLLNHREKMNRSKLSKFLLIYKSTLKKKVLKPNKKYNKRSLNFFVKKFNLNKIKLLSLKTKKFRAVINYKYVKKIKINKKIFFKDSKIENLYFFNLACTQSIYLLKSFSIFYKLCFNVIMNFKTKLKAKKKKKKLFLEAKSRKKLLLLNIFFNKKKILKPSINHIKKVKNFSIKIKFIKYFFKKLIINNKTITFLIHFKIKKHPKEKKTLRKKKKIFFKI